MQAKLEMTTFCIAMVYYHEMIWMQIYYKEENFYYLLFKQWKFLKHLEKDMPLLNELNADLLLDHAVKRLKSLKIIYECTK